MANALRLGSIPSCYKLKHRAVYCELDGGHYHMMEGVWVLGMDLELLGSGRTGLLDCKKALVQNIMPAVWLYKKRL